MENNKVVGVAEKVKAFAIAFIGICFFSIGITYFEERLVYRLPRIFVPILDTLGNEALAIATLILGAAFIYYGFATWKKVSQKSAIYWIIAVVGLAVGSGLAVWSESSSKKDPAEIRNEMEQNRQNQIDEIKNVEKLNFSNANVDKYIADFNTIYARYQQAMKDNNAEEIAVCQDEYYAWLPKSADLMGELNNDQKYELSRYLAKLSIMWSEVE